VPDGPDAADPGAADPDAGGPTAVADAAARRAGVEVVDLHHARDLDAASTLFDAVWGRPGTAGAVLGVEALTAIAHAGGQVSVARLDCEVVGATAAFLGRADDGTPFLHSHVTGVLPAAPAGTGTSLKWHQRAWCLDRGIDEVRWTFDPLIRRNLAFNLVRLGAQVDRYLEDAYGPMPDDRNAGLPTDRLVARWALTSPRVAAAAAGRTASPDVDALRRSGAEVAVDEATDGGPRVSPTGAPRVLVRVPTDVETMRRTDPDLALAWVDAIRETLGAALRRGARVSGATRDGWIVVASGDRVTELRDQGGRP
jgi:predicted GNAT superfamily acetyltransferase